MPTRRRRRSRRPRPARWRGPAPPRRTSRGRSPSGPPQACVNAASLDGGKQVDQHPVQRGEHGRVAVVLRPDPGAEVVRRAAAAEGEPAVGGALAVDDQVPVVGEGLALAQPDPVPHVVGQRLGGDHQRVDRRDVAAQAGQPAVKPSVARTTTSARTRPCGVRHDAAARSRSPACRSWIVHAAPLDGAGQPADQPGRVDRRAVRGVRRRPARRLRAEPGRAPRRRRAARGRPRRSPTRGPRATSAAGALELDRRARQRRRCRPWRSGSRCPRSPRPGRPRRRSRAWRGAWRDARRPRP